MFWLSPRAWLGVAALTIPIAIHLLTRQKARRLFFPTLRFLRSTQLAALRRRSIHDWPLLTVRLLILLAAVAALAGPVFVSNDRHDQWRRRIARALVVATSSSNRAPQLETLIAEERRDAFLHAVFRPSDHLTDGVRDAVAWLERQPPAAREVVILGDLKEGAIAEPDLALIPGAVGLRFLPTPRATTEATEPTETENTEMAERPKAREVPIEVRAAREDEALAHAALNAVLSRGVRFDRLRNRRVLVAFDGADAGDLELQRPAAGAWMRDALSRLAGMSGGQHRETLVVMTHRRANGPGVVHVIDRVAHAAFLEDLTALESRRIAAVTLAAWARPPGYVDAAPPTDEGDRRWLWGAVLALMLAEALLRQRSPLVAPAVSVEEKQVA